MTPCYDDGWASLYVGDALETLREIPDGAAQMCVTSPPYWGLRDYGTAQWEMPNGKRDSVSGGDDVPGVLAVDSPVACDHIAGTAASRTSTLKNDGRPNPGSNNYERSVVVPYRDVCGKCGAKRIDRQLGLETTPEEYVCRMVDVFREVRRVLRDDGTLWLNIGDSYANTSPMGRAGEKMQGARKAQWGDAYDPELSKHGGQATPASVAIHGMKPKDLVGIPWMLAFALRADGWYLRSDIIWSKPNPMPESVTDRPTKAHEYLFLLSKRDRYWYDADAIREAAEWARWGDQTTPKEQMGTAKWIAPKSKAELQERRTDKQRGHSRRHAGFNDRWDGMSKEEQGAMGRNKRTVWTIATEPYPEAHFATFPTALVKPCVLAGCPEGGTVLEPFAGSGTTLQVAKELGRKSIGIELNADYAKLATQRLMRVPQPFPVEEPA